MASLFSDLPAPHAQSVKQGSAHAGMDGTLTSQHGENDASLVPGQRPEKRQRTVEGPAPAGAAAHAPCDAAHADAGPGTSSSDDQVPIALARIASHISNPKKFAKAAGLLRQLIEGGALSKAHRRPLFAAIKAAFADSATVTEPTTRREYTRLIKAVASLPPGVLGRQEVTQMEVYTIRAIHQNELFTDDSFALNKALGKLKEAIKALPDVTEEEEAAAERLLLPSGAPNPSAGAQQQHEGQQPQPAADAEADPFGLDAFLAQQAAEAGEPGEGGGAAGLPVEAAPERLTWDHAEMAVMQAQALLECVQT